MICHALITLTIIIPISWTLPAQNIPNNLQPLPPNEVNNFGAKSRSFSHNTIPKPNAIEETVKEVEAMIKANPTLPRLTRGEILDLLENITESDRHKLQESSDARHSKAIMVVMPYTMSPSNDNHKSMEELYTKAPITHIIGAEPFKANPEMINNHRRRPVIDKRRNEAPATTTRSPPQQFMVPSKQRKRRPPTTTTTTTTESTTTYRTINRRRSTTTKHPNHRYPADEDKKIPSLITKVDGSGTLPGNGGLRIITPPNLNPPPSPLQINDLNGNENVKQEIIYRPIKRLTTTPTTTTTTSTTTKPISMPFINDLDLPNNLNKIVHNMNLESVLSEDEIKSMTSTTLRTTTVPKQLLPSSSTTMPDVKNLADTLSPEMQDLLITFGLIPNPNEKPKLNQHHEEKYISDNAEVKPESYVGFKPLPDDGPSREGMDELLASFGLGRSARQQKSAIHNANKQQPQPFDIVPDSLKSVLDDLGLNRHGKKIGLSGQGNSLPSKTTKDEKKQQHVFKPNNEQAITSNEDLDKLTKLIDMIKQLDKLNRTVTDEDLKKIDMNNLKKLIGSLNNSTDNFVTLDEIRAPDPVGFDQGIQKNEVKRQETTTTTEEPRNPSLSDLEASFGGQTEPAVTEAAVPETTTAVRTGFYYLVDWNTFLDIDDQKGKRVNLRFQPTIGNPKQFISVAVP